jgi:TatD DNase family protein
MSEKKHHGPAISPESLGMPLTGVDSHAHLDLYHFGEDVAEVLERAELSGVANIGNVFLSVAAWEEGRALFAEYPGFFFLLGIHPTDAMHYTLDERAGMDRAFAADPRLRAVGEIGLDFYWKDCPKEIQIPAFIDQLHFARDRKLPVVIHSRDAFEETLDILRDQGFYGYPVLWHCFGGDIVQVRRLVEARWHISIPGPVTFPANEVLREAVAAIPADKLLVETDCPYLTPAPYRGKRNEPAYTVFTAAKIAEVLGEDAASLWTQCGDNARRFFSLA